MLNPSLPPMAGGSGDRHDVICIEAQKVFDFCFQEHRVDRDFTLPDGFTVTGLTPVECRIETDRITCREVERQEIAGKKGKFLICLAIEVPVVIIVGHQTIRQRIVFLKQAVLFAPEGTRIQCEVTGNCCCFFDEPTGTVSCVFDFCVVISAKATVRILVPTFGLCAPKACKAVTTGCPPRVPKDFKHHFKDFTGHDRDFTGRDFSGRDCSGRDFSGRDRDFTGRDKDCCD